jgi:VWFA-related protein
MHRSFGLSTIALCVAFVCAAQEAPPTFQTGADVVLLDMVVRDKRGQPVLDLRQDEIQVSEDGSRCEVLSVRLVQAGAVKIASPPPKSPGATPPPAADGIAPEIATTPARSSLVVLVFDQLSPEDARRARDAASEFAAKAFPPDTWFAVAKVGRGVRLLQTFTSNPADLPNAIAAATIGGDTTRDAALSPGFDSATEQALGAGPVNGSGIRLDQMSEFDRMNQGFAKQFDLAQRTQQGHASIAPLRAIVKGLEPVQGRKTLLYFSEGLQLPPDVQTAYDTLVSDANRANVTVYSLDTRGLTIRSPTENSRLRLQPSLQAPGDGDPMTVTKPALGRDDQEDGLRGLNVQANAESLALATGGFLIGNSNDLRPGLDRVAGELASYYEVAYVPPNAERDGEFRRIQAKVLRPGATLRTRSGYVRLPATAPDVQARDLPLMSALSAPTPPRAFDQRAQVLHFEARGNEREALLLLEVPLAKVQLARDQDRKTYHAHLSLVALIKDEAGRLVTRLSHDWPLEGPLDQADSAAQGTVTFRRSLRLAPGRYRLEAAVQDRGNGALSVERLAFTVPGGGPGLALSSLSILKQGEAPAADEPAADPLRVASVVLRPDLDASLKQGARNASFFLQVYPAGSAPVEATVEVRRDGEIVGQSQPKLPARDEKGQVAWIGGLDTSSFPPGSYELAVMARQGTDVAEERVPFRIDPQPGAPKGATSGPALATDPALATLLERAGHYVADYEQTFKSLVAQEEYYQWETDGTRSARRLLRSDLVFASMPGPIPWTCFRDVYSVDGQKVREREARLEKLFLQGTASAFAKAEAIRKESSRYNIGTAVRNINVPTLALLFLHPQNQGRFRFERKGQRWFSGTPGAEVAFTEVVEPSLVNDGHDDLPGEGRFWIDTNRGTVLRSEVTYRFMPARAFAKISVEYRPEPGLNIWVPAEMKERYEDLAGAWAPVFRTRTEGTARYSNYRRFSVSTEEKAEVREP